MSLRKAVVYVEWLDSCHPARGEWEYSWKIKPFPPAKIRTAGIILRETKTYITLALSVTEGQVKAR